MMTTGYGTIWPHALKCERAVIAVFAYGDATRPQQPSPKACPSDPEKWGFALTDVLPRPRPSRAPDHLPVHLPNIFLQAANALKRGDWDASGAMSRKTLDVATKVLMGMSQGSIAISVLESMR
jgi:hypothetical protein